MRLMMLSGAMGRPANTDRQVAHGPASEVSTISTVTAVQRTARQAVVGWVAFGGVAGRHPQARKHGNVLHGPSKTVAPDQDSAKVDRLRWRGKQEC
jgi:hypothetical protein